MDKTILNDNQIRVLDAVSQSRELCDFFYLTGGTALAEFYLRHRLSEDLDFFSESEFDVAGINAFLAKNKSKLGIKKIDFQRSFNRNLYFLDFKDGSVKMEFTYFPFPRIEKKRKHGALNIDSAIDIAVNKIFTVYQNPRSRDFIDLYCINKSFGFDIGGLVKKAKVKFDFHVDSLQLGSQFLKVRVLKDYPTMAIDIKNDDWQNYFEIEAQKLKSRIIKP